jgi:hypothetical protein
MHLQRATAAIIAAGSIALVFAGAAGSAASPLASCVGKFVTTFAPQSSGEFGGVVAGLAQTTEPNLGQGDVTIDARAPHDQCRG